MGTSKQYGGPKAGNPLIPDWLPDPLPQTEPSEPVGEEPSENPTEEQEPHQNNHEDQQAKLPTFMPARNAFTRFSKSGDSKHLHKALSNYVGRGTGGARSATHRMGPSRSAAATLLGFVQTLAQDGVPAACASIGLEDFGNLSPEDALGSLTDVICPNGGLIDDSLAREAWIEAVLDLIQQGVEDLGTLTQAQWMQLFRDFISRSIERRIFADIAQNGISLPIDLGSVEQIQRDLHVLISCAVQEAVESGLQDNTRLSTDQIQPTIDNIYESAFVYLRALEE